MSACLTTAPPTPRPLCWWCARATPKASKYSDEGQDIAGKHFYRPISAKAQAKYAKQFPKLNLFTVDQAFGGWAKAKKDHFADGANFDQIYARK